MKAYLALTKSGIILFALASAFAGFAMSVNISQPIDWNQPILLAIGLYFVCAGSFALNQAQEWKIDARMERTKNRPIPSGKMSVSQVVLLGTLLLLFGLGMLWLLKPLTAEIALLTVALYNGFYTWIWKRRWAFGAVPGAIPGALPVVIGFSVNNDYIFAPECIYLFLIMFLWQMPHFWCLAIRYREDYARGGIPVLPTQMGVPRTLFQIGLYSFVYVGVAMASPWFLKTNVLYLLLVVPLCLKLVWELWKYVEGGGDKSWLPFFLWTNLSMLVFLAAPVVDKWFFVFVNT